MQKICSFALLVCLAFLSACSSQPAATPQTPIAETSPPAAQTTAPVATATIQPTPVFESVTDGTETVPTAVGVTSVLTGTVAFRDQTLRNDTVTVQITGLTAPENGQVYAAWLGSADGSLPLGQLNVTSGVATLTFVSPTQENLLAKYERAYITQAAQAEASSEVKNVMLFGALPPQALVHIRHVLSSFPETPGKIGFALGLRQETDEVLRHAQFLKEAQDAGDLRLVKVHAEHLINIVRGSEARDVNGDGKLQNPGDGFGLLANGQQLGYIKGMVDHAKLAADAPDATADVKLHSNHVQIAGENTRVRIDELRLLAEQIAGAGDLAQTNEGVLKILALAQQTIQGLDLNLDEQVGPVPGEGGVITAYQHAQLMAGMRVDPALAASAPLPGAAAPVAVPAAAAAQTINIAVGDNSFTPNKITVAAGTRVIWTNTGQRTHNVVADDGSFKSPDLKNGESFEFTFTKAGTFSYYCEYHGGAGGAGMAGAIVVEGQSAAAPVQAPVAQAPVNPAPAQPSNPVPADGAQDVSIGDNVFSPAALNVPVGATVTWKHEGQRKHTVTAQDRSFDSGTLDAGATFQQTFSQAGTFSYYCDFHTGMEATIVVGGSASNAPPATDHGASHTAVPAPTQQAAATTQQAATTTQVPAAPGPITIAMQDNQFEPKEIRVKAGSTVVWNNVGKRRHSAQGVGEIFDTGLFDPGQSKSVTFATPGEFLYFCELHGSPDGQSDMVGKVIVES